MTAPWHVKFSRLSAMFLVSALALALSVAVALAHTSLVKSEPADGTRLQQSPPRIVAWFDQELDASASSIAIFDAQGHAGENIPGGVDLADPGHASMVVKLGQPLKPGGYTVRWSAVSAEADHAGHETTGEFIFEIGN